MFAMFNVFSRCCTVFLAAAFLLGPLMSERIAGLTPDAAFAQAADSSEAKAFEESKALGTVEACDLTWLF